MWAPWIHGEVKSIVPARRGGESRSCRHVPCLVSTFVTMTRMTQVVTDQICKELLMRRTTEPRGKAEAKKTEFNRVSTVVSPDPVSHYVVLECSLTTNAPASPSSPRKPSHSHRVLLAGLSPSSSAPFQLISSWPPACLLMHI